MRLVNPHPFFTCADGLREHLLGFPRDAKFGPKGSVWQARSGKEWLESASFRNGEHYWRCFDEAMYFFKMRTLLGDSNHNNVFHALNSVGKFDRSLPPPVYGRGQFGGARPKDAQAKAKPRPKPSSEADTAIAASTTKASAPQPASVLASFPSAYDGDEDSWGAHWPGAKAAAPAPAAAAAKPAAKASPTEAPLRPPGMPPMMPAPGEPFVAPAEARASGHKPKVHAKSGPLLPSALSREQKQAFRASANFSATKVPLTRSAWGHELMRRLKAKRAAATAAAAPDASVPSAGAASSSAPAGPAPKRKSKSKPLVSPAPASATAAARTTGPKRRKKAKAKAQPVAHVPPPSQPRVTPGGPADFILQAETEYRARALSALLTVERGRDQNLPSPPPFPAHLPMPSEARQATLKSEAMVRFHNYTREERSRIWPFSTSAGRPQVLDLDA